MPPYLRLRSCAQAKRCVELAKLMSQDTGKWPSRRDHQNAEMPGKANMVMMLFWWGGGDAVGRLLFIYDLPYGILRMWRGLCERLRILSGSAVADARF